VILGAKRGIFSNVIAPVAGSRMTATVMPPELVERYVIVLYFFNSDFEIVCCYCLLGIVVVVIV
jgi:hypothetical protein